MAVAVRGGQVPGVILHIDRGSEYTARAFRAACERLSITQSMGRPSSALDSAVIESLPWTRIGKQIAPFAAAVRQIDEVPGINLAAAPAVLAEIGLDMGRFPAAGHLVSWEKYAPGVKESAG
jgi:transposase InsO family protein